jgi:hypothetical protein
MKFTSNTYVVLFIITLVVGCSENNISDKQLIQSILSLDIFDEKKHKVILIMPSTGCSGCISSLEEFVRENNSSSLLLILTNSPSQKDALHRLNLVNPLCDYFWDSDKVFHDSNDDQAVYPKIIYWDEDDEYSSKLSIVKPENPDVIIELRDFLTELKF